MTPGRSSSLRARRARQPSIWPTAAQNVTDRRHSDVVDDSSSAVTPAGLFLCRSTGDEFLLLHRRTPADGTDTTPGSCHRRTKSLASLIAPRPSQSFRRSFRGPRVGFEVRCTTLAHFHVFGRSWARDTLTSDRLSDSAASRRLGYPNGFDPSSLIFNSHRFRESELYLVRDPP